MSGGAGVTMDFRSTVTKGEDEKKEGLCRTTDGAGIKKRPAHKEKERVIPAKSCFSKMKRPLKLS